MNNRNKFIQEKINFEPNFGINFIVKLFLQKRIIFFSLFVDFQNIISTNVHAY